MRVAALFDVHGNLPALEAVLAELERDPHELVIGGGDVCLGPMPAEVLGLLRSLEPARFVRGNCDREVAGGGSGAGGVWGDRNRWCAERLSAEDRVFLGGLPLRQLVDVDGLGPVCFVHATPRSDEEIVTGATPADLLAEAFAGAGAAIAVCGHTHVQFDRRVASLRVVNAGSVGMPYADRQGAYWASLGPDVRLRRTEYDLDTAAARIRDSGYPAADEFVAENVLTVPFAEEATSEFERAAER